MEHDIVWLQAERVYGEVLRYGAYASLVRFTKNGTDFEVWVENEDFESWEEHVNNYEQE